MKALLLCPVRGNSWVRKFFPNHPLYLLPFANKPAIEFALDFCFLSGIHEVRILSDEESSVLHGHYRTGEMNGLDISSFRTISPELPASMSWFYSVETLSSGALALAVSLGVPEPATWILFAFGAFFMLLRGVHVRCAAR